MNRLRLVQTFTQVAAAESFTKAAELLGLSRGAVSRHIAELETGLGVVLLRRNTRHVKLTELGEQYFRNCKSLLRQFERVDQTISGMQQALSGPLRVVCKRTFGMLQLSPAIADFRMHYPNIDVSLFLDDHLSSMANVLEDSFDVAIRISPLAPSTLRAQKLATLRWVLCVTPEYLRAHGPLHHPHGLEGQNCLFHLHHAVVSQRADWRFVGPDGITTVRVSGYPCSNNVMCLKAAVLRGLGVALLPTYCIGEELTAGRLITVLDEFRLESRTLYAVHHPGGGTPKKVKTFIQYLRERYRKPEWDAGLSGQWR